MDRIVIEFPEHQIIIHAQLLVKKAPITCQAFWEILHIPLETTCRHAMYTGRELSVQLPASRAGSTSLHQVVPENLTCYPAPGELLYTFMPSYAWEGLPDPIYDLGIFYGHHCRTFFPMGWVAGNSFAVVDQEDLPKLAQMGNKAITEGIQRLRIRRA
jgi:hypothetical protein